MGRQLIDFTKSQGKIEDQIFELIRFGETEFLDFKQEWHKCRAELLHDILYLANARSDNDRYIVFGINDACNNFCKTNFWFGAHREELERYVDGVTDEDYKQKQNDLTQILDNCSLNKN